MKKIINITPLLCLPVIFLFHSCAKNHLSKLTYEGVIYDSLGGNPVAGVSIQLRACSGDNGRSQCNNFEVGTSTTDSNGHFIIKGQEAKSDRYFIEYHNQNSAKVLGGSFDISGEKLQSSYCTKLYLK
jgi:hypothetical protein